MNANTNTRNNTRNNNSRRGKRAYIASGTATRPSSHMTLGSAFEASNHRLFAAPTSDGFTEVVGRKAASKAKIAMYKPQDMVSAPNRFDKPTENVVEEGIPAAKAAPLRGAWAAGRPTGVKPHQELRPKLSQGERKRQVAEHTAQEKALAEKAKKQGFSLWADEE